MKVSIVGAGYVGLVTGVGLASLGHDICIVEKDERKLEKLNNGISPIFEPGLEELLNKYKEKIIFTNNLKKAIAFSEIIFLCVGTPAQDDGSADLSQIEDAVIQIFRNVNSYKLIVEKSTVPVNTHKLIKWLANRYGGKSEFIDVASNPEFLREGKALYDFLNPDRIIIGVETEKAKKLLLELYEKIDAPKLVVKPATAETIKYTANAFLAMKISFINMIADFCEKTGADVEEVALGIGFDKRIGKDFLKAGIGYGGSCFPKDLKAFIYTANEYGIDFSLLKEVEKINCNRVEKVFRMIKNVLWNLVHKKIAVWGLAFKAGTDDVRYSPAIRLIKKLIENRAYVYGYDPKAIDNFKRSIGFLEGFSAVDDLYEVLDDADALVIVTDWQEFKEADLEEVKKRLKLPIIIDTRNIFDPDNMLKQGFEYYCIGRSGCSNVQKNI